MENGGKLKMQEDNINFNDNVFVFCGIAGEWKNYPHNKPEEAKKYLVYRKSCEKVHFEKWNNISWAYNNNTITHYAEIKLPIF